MFSNCHTSGQERRVLTCVSNSRIAVTVISVRNFILFRHSCTLMYLFNVGSQTVQNSNVSKILGLFVQSVSWENEWMPLKLPKPHPIPLNFPQPNWVSCGQLAITRYIATSLQLISGIIFLNQPKPALHQCRTRMFFLRIVPGSSWHVSLHRLTMLLVKKESIDELSPKSWPSESCCEANKLNQFYTILWSKKKKKKKKLNDWCKLFLINYHQFGV